MGREEGLQGGRYLYRSRLTTVPAGATFRSSSLRVLMLTPLYTLEPTTFQDLDGAVGNAMLTWIRAALRAQACVKQLRGEALFESGESSVCSWINKFKNQGECGSGHSPARHQSDRNRKTFLLRSCG